MRAYELAKILDIFSNILKSGPDIDIDDLSKVFKHSLSKLENEKKSKEDKKLSISYSQIEELLELQPEQLVNELKDSKKYSMPIVRALVSTLGISTSARQSRDALINTIIMHFASINMDKLIRSTRERNVTNK